jgi:hypothetical protein
MFGVRMFATLLSTAIVGIFVMGYVIQKKFIEPYREIATIHCTPTASVKIDVTDYSTEGEAGEKK